MGNISNQVSNIANSGTRHYFQADSADDGSDDAAASGKQAVAAGANANASGGSFTVLGANSIASQTAAIAVGSGATASGAANCNRHQFFHNDTRQRRARQHGDRRR